MTREIGDAPERLQIRNLTEARIYVWTWLWTQDWIRSFVVGWAYRALLLLAGIVALLLAPILLR